MSGLERPGMNSAYFLDILRARAPPRGRRCGLPRLGVAKNMVVRTPSGIALRAARRARFEYRVSFAYAQLFLRGNYRRIVSLVERKLDRFAKSKKNESSSLRPNRKPSQNVHVHPGRDNAHRSWRKKITKHRRENRQDFPRFEQSSRRLLAQS